MQRCLNLAKLGAGYVAPNPMVGAVLVYNNIIIGEGYHKKFGEPHAEVNCVNSVSLHNEQFIHKATLYVSLEPCAHYGKTPPCVELILQKDIMHVIIGCNDSYEKVNGKAIKQLQAAGVKVDLNILYKACREINKHFFTFNEKGRPYIYLKYAQSSDLFIAGENKQPVNISNNFTNIKVHKWRAQVGAILVGTNTAINDNPKLTTRHWVGKNAVRMVIDLNLSIPNSAQVFDNAAPTIIFNKINSGNKNGIYYYKIIDSQKVEEAILDCCKQHNISSLLIEGGAKTLQNFIDKNLWDESIVITNNDLKILKGVNSPKLKAAHLVKEKNVLTDSIHFYKNKHNDFL